ncbi:MAG: hypothetical protein GXO07_00750 [Crenarchaeota archaeon]|nr:hypothetical protein [Thermoproteota archaeon]
MRISPNGKAEPLHSLFEFPDRYEILIDMPLADEGTLSVTLYKRVLKVRALLRETIKIGEIEVREYIKILKIPDEVEEEYEVEVVEREGPIVVVVFPKAGRP